nr:MAG TPA_asm: hypothetical protein [Caudoviricetes sp.]
MSQILPFINGVLTCIICHFFCLPSGVGVLRGADVIFSIFELNTTTAVQSVKHFRPKDSRFRIVMFLSLHIHLKTALVLFDFSVLDVQGIAIQHFLNSSHVNHFLFLLSNIKCKDRQDCHAICKLKADCISCQFQLPRVLWKLVWKCQCSICHFQPKRRMCP